jgi:CheY-like chemotaxis protein
VVIADELTHCSIEVIDTGIGITEEQLPRLFAPFERLGRERSSVEGTGLGLNLTKRMIEHMDGRISVKSAVGKGTTFSVRLPKPSIKPLEQQQFPVLYIEDDPTNVRLMQSIMRKRPKIDCQYAMTGREGLELLGQQMFSLLILDLNLPDIGGREVLRRIRQMPQLQYLPVLILSADAFAQHDPEFTELRILRFLPKPYQVGELFELLDGLLEEHLFRR